MTDEAMDEMLSDLWYNDVQKKIKEYGLAVIGVFGTEEDPGPPFTYSIGLSEKYGFELVVFGMPNQYAGMMLNDIAAKLAVGETLNLNVPDDRWANLPVKFMEADESVHGYTVQADRYYQQKVRVLQIVLPDKDGKFFNEEGYDHEYMNIRQPICTTTQHQSQLH